MRLIDADALLNAVKYTNIALLANSTAGYTAAYAQVSNAVEAINAAPTIKIEPVSADGCDYCLNEKEIDTGVCGMGASIRGSTLVTWEYEEIELTYCPFCGRKLKGEE